jgi:hypothetical protein
MNNRLFRRETLDWTCVALVISLALAGCEYVRPTLNVPLKQWNPRLGGRILQSNIADLVRARGIAWLVLPR